MYSLFSTTTTFTTTYYFTTTTLLLLPLPDSSSAHMTPPLTYKLWYTCSTNRTIPLITSNLSPKHTRTHLYRPPSPLAPPTPLLFFLPPSCETVLLPNHSLLITLPIPLPLLLLHTPLLLLLLPLLNNPKYPPKYFISILLKLYYELRIHDIDDVMATIELETPSNGKYQQPTGLYVLSPRLFCIIVN